jgi:hypothetical protein
LSAFLKLANNAEKASLGSRAREKRFRFFLQLMDPVDRPLSILDVGGTPAFWERMGFADPSEAQITLVNLKEVEVNNPVFTSLAGSACDLSRFDDQSFDIVFSNSVIEHVGGLKDQQDMAAEVMRVGKRYFVQTPNKWFPIEPHFLLPWFQFYPVWFRIMLMRRFALGYAKAPISDLEKARDHVTRIRLLSRSEFQDLFPPASMYDEKMFGLNKSFVAYGGW